MNPIFQPVEFVYSYTIGGKQIENNQIIPQKKQITETQRIEINNLITQSFATKNIKKIAIKQESIKIIDKSRFLKIFYAFKWRRNKISKLGRRLIISQRERVFDFISDEEQDQKDQIKQKDQYDLDYDKGKLKKVKKKKEIIKLDFDRAQLRKKENNV